MWKLIGAEIMTKVFLVFEEGFLGNKLVENIWFQVFPPPIYTHDERVSARVIAMVSVSPSPPYMPVHG